MFSITSARYYLYREPTDMRKSFDGLCGFVTSKLGQNPMSGDMFVFINKPRNRIKLLRWETGGFVLFYKRLEKGTFQLPKACLPDRQAKPSSLSLKIEYSDLVMIVHGISMEYATKRRRFYSQNIVGN